METLIFKLEVSDKFTTSSRLSRVRRLTCHTTCRFPPAQGTEARKEVLGEGKDVDLLLAKRKGNLYGSENPTLSSPLCA